MTPKSENDDEISSVGQTILVDERLGITNQNSKQTQVVITTGESIDSLAKEKKNGARLHENTVRAELRVKFLRSLTNLGVGTNRIEHIRSEVFI